MNREDTKKAIEVMQHYIEVMQHYVDGGQVEIYSCTIDEWEIVDDPDFDFYRCEYRIAVTKPSIDWSHVHKDYKWLATDGNDFCYVYKNCPNMRNSDWENVEGLAVCAETFASFKPGNCDWKDSLVKRPDQDETE